MSTALLQSLSDAELSFAQQLASGETTVRRKALIKLTKWFKSTLKHSAMSETDFMRLWKGLYYCMWMQDKMLLQEELADTMCALLPTCGSEDKCLMFAECCYTTLAVEWPAIDKFRLDKFMMMEQDESDESGDESSTGATSVDGKTTALDGCLQFDYAAIGGALFDIGRKAGVTANRRKKIYELVAKFETAAKGGNPFAEAADNDGDSETEGDKIEMAANRLLRREEAARLLLERGTHPLAKAGKQKRGMVSHQQSHEHSAEDSDDDIVEVGENELSVSDDSDDGESAPPKKKAYVPKSKQAKKRSGSATKAASVDGKKGGTVRKPAYVKKNKKRGKK